MKLKMLVDSILDHFDRLFKGFLLLFSYVRFLANVRFIGFFVARYKRRKLLLFFLGLK